MSSIEFESSTYRFTIVKTGRSLRLVSNDFEATLRELEVLQQKAQGLTIWEIACNLELSPHTVGMLLESIRARNTTEVDGKEMRPTTISLIVKAQSLELLTPISLLALQHLEKRMHLPRP